MAEKPDPEASAAKSSPHGSPPIGLTHLKLHQHLHCHPPQLSPPRDNAMRWPFWATEKKDDAPSTPSASSSSNNGVVQDTTAPGNAPRHVSSWSSPNLPTDWRHYTSPDVLFPVAVITSSLLVGRRMYKLYLRRFTGASTISKSFWRKRSLLGQVTSVGDGDGFRMFHTPGGRLAGWGWLPGRKIPERKALKDNTISVRIAGVDAPETAHFGQPGQPGGKEALDWLRKYLTGRKVRAYIWRKDQYERAVATVYVKRWGGLWSTDVGLVMLKKGLATVYEAKTGAEFGNLEEKYRRAEFWAKTFKRGIWRRNEESPREFKTRMKAEGGKKSDDDKALDDKPMMKAAEKKLDSKIIGKKVDVKPVDGKIDSKASDKSKPSRKSAQTKKT